MLLLSKVGKVKGHQTQKSEVRTMGPFTYGNKVSTFKIYLSGLPDGLKSSEIRALFEPYGRIVECEVFKKNYGFVVSDFFDYLPCALFYMRNELYYVRVQLVNYAPLLIL